MARPLIALSIGDSEDLADLGFGQEHLDDLALRLAKKLLARRARLTYGGVLRPEVTLGLGAQHSFLDVLIDIVAEEGVRDAKCPPLVNPQPWPWYKQVEVSTRATHFGVIQFVDVDPPGDKVEMKDDRFLWTMASACTEMRKRMTGGHPGESPQVPGCAARVVLGGKRRDWAGILPGIAEEVLYMLEAQKPVYLLGGYGGCAKVIVDYLIGDTDDLPDELTFAGHASSPKLQKIIGHAPPNTVPQAFARLDSALRAVRSDRAHLHNGLTPSENDQLMRSENIRNIGRLLNRGLDAALGSP